MHKKFQNRLEEYDREYIQTKKQLEMQYQKLAKQSLSSSFFQESSSTFYLHLSKLYRIYNERNKYLLSQVNQKVQQNAKNEQILRKRQSILKDKDIYKKLREYEEKQNELEAQNQKYRQLMNKLKDQNQEYKTHLTQLKLLNKSLTTENKVLQKYFNEVSSQASFEGKAQIISSLYEKQKSDSRETQRVNRKASSAFQENISQLSNKVKLDDFILKFQKEKQQIKNLIRQKNLQLSEKSQQVNQLKFQNQHLRKMNSSYELITQQASATIAKLKKQVTSLQKYSESLKEQLQQIKQNNKEKDLFQLFMNQQKIFSPNLK